MPVNPRNPGQGIRTLLFGGGQAAMFQKILVPTDGSAAALKAAQSAVALAEQFNGTVTLLHVVQHFYNLPSMAVWDAMIIPPTVLDNIETIGQNILAKTLDSISPTTVKIDTRLEHGQPAECIVRIAKQENFTLIVIGNRGLSGFNQLLLGSVSNQVANYASCPVLIIKDDAKTRG